MALTDYIPYGRQDITQDDINAVIDVLKSDFLTQGPQGPKFEKAIQRFCNAKHAISFNSATSALHLAYLSLGLKCGDWLWTSPITFVASANSALYCGAKVDFVDIDPDTYNLCPKALEKKLIFAKKIGKLPKVVVPVHLSGQPCDMQSISTLAEKYGFKVVEDASHAIGGKYLNQPIGNCAFSDITVFSFHPVKIITSGEGGMAITNNSKLAQKMFLLRSHGITRNPSEMTHDPDGDWYYQQIDLGFNYRMTDIQAALGMSQLKRLDQYVLRRNELAYRYNELLKDLPLVTPFQHKNGLSSFHLYIIRLKNRNKHKQTFDTLRAKGIGVNLHYIPLYRQPYYQFNDSDYNNFPESESYYSEAITIPLYPMMSNLDQDVVIQAIKESL